MVNSLPHLLDVLFGDNPDGFSTLIPKKLWVELWGLTDGIHRQPITIGPINNGQAKVSPDIEFTTEEPCTITHIQIVDENNDPLITFSPADLFTVPHHATLNKGDSLRITSFHISFYD